MLGGAGLDRLVQRLAKSLESVTLDAFAPGLQLTSLQQHYESLLSLRTSGALERLFQRDTARIDAAVVPIHGFPLGGVYDLEFHSTFPRDSWSHDPEYAALVQNQISYVRLWEHSDRNPARRTIVAIHGWKDWHEMTGEFTVPEGYHRENMAGN